VDTIYKCMNLNLAIHVPHWYIYEISPVLLNDSLHNRDIFLCTKSLSFKTCFFDRPVEALTFSVFNRLVCVLNTKTVIEILYYWLSTFIGENSIAQHRIWCIANCIDLLESQIIGIIVRSFFTETTSFRYQSNGSSTSFCT